MTDKEIELKISGVVTTKKPHLEWLDDFIDWLESRGEFFGGGVSELKEEDIDEV